MIIALSAFSRFRHTTVSLNPKTLHSETCKGDWFSRKRKGGFSLASACMNSDWSLHGSSLVTVDVLSDPGQLFYHTYQLPPNYFSGAETIHNSALITSLWYIPTACLSIPPLSTFYVLIAPRKYEHSHVIAFLLASLSVESDSIELHFYTTTHGIRWRVRKWFLFSTIYFSNCMVRKYIKPCT